MSDRRTRVLREGHDGIALAVASVTAAMADEFADLDDLMIRPKRELVDAFVCLLAICQGVASSFGPDLFVHIAQDLGLASLAAVEGVDRS